MESAPISVGIVPFIVELDREMNPVANIFAVSYHCKKAAMIRTKDEHLLIWHTNVFHWSYFGRYRACPVIFPKVQAILHGKWKKWGRCMLEHIGCVFFDKNVHAFIRWPISVGRLPVRALLRSSSCTLQKQCHWTSVCKNERIVKKETRFDIEAQDSRRLVGSSAGNLPLKELSPKYSPSIRRQVKRAVSS